MTNLLELITCGSVELRTLGQKIVPCPEMASRLLQINVFEEVNERDIIMVRSSDGYPLLHAKSFTPISRLDPTFKSDLMRADIPIGKILQKYRIESRRELIDMGLIERDERLRELLRCKGPYIWRSYNIITRDLPLITIRESLPTSLYLQPEAESS
jgi:beta-ribofuranosylaminobenzene 5'-phosphate synthase